jgi:hypothetical protein
MVGLATFQELLKQGLEQLLANHGGMEMEIECLCLTAAGITTGDHIPKTELFLQQLLPHCKKFYLCSDTLSPLQAALGSADGGVLIAGTGVVGLYRQNGETKQLIEYDIASTNTKMSRLITVELLEGENEITFTTTLAEYIIDHVPYVEETYRKVWIDHDYLLLSEGLSGMSTGSNDYDEGDSDFDHSQLTPTLPTEDPKDDPSDDPTVESTVDSTVDTTADPTVESTVGGSSGTDKDDDDGSILPTIIWILAVASAVCVTCIVIILCNKKKANKKHNRNTRF